MGRPHQGRLVLSLCPHPHPWPLPAGWPPTSSSSQGSWGFRWPQTYVPPPGGPPSLWPTPPAGLCLQPLYERPLSSLSPYSCGPNPALVSMLKGKALGLPAPASGPSHCSPLHRQTPGGSSAPLPRLCPPPLTHQSHPPFQVCLCPVPAS